MAKSNEEQRQLTLESFEAIGVGKATELPEGVSELTPRELRFVLGVLEHGQMAKAAMDAGYSAESAGAIASETLRRPKVFAFYRRCLDRVAKQSDQMIARVYERSVVLHAQALEAAQKLKDANEWLLNVCRDESGKNYKSVKEYELARERAQRDQKHFITLANQTDALLGTLLGKIAGVHVSGEVNHTYTHKGEVGVIPAEALPAFAAIRRSIVEERMQATVGGSN